MDQNEFVKKLREVEHSESMFSRIMHANTVQELIEISAGPEELWSYFQAAEEMGKLVEESSCYGKRLAQKLRDTKPARRSRRIFI